VLATVTSKLEWTARSMPSGDGDSGGWAWARGHGDNDVTFNSGGGCECQAQDEYHHTLFSSIESILGGGGEGKGDGCDVNDGAGNNNSGYKRTGAGGIFGRLCPIYKLHDNVPHHKWASTLHAFGNGG
jgi:hypothetical protein